MPQNKVMKSDISFTDAVSQLKNLSQDLTETTRSKKNDKYSYITYNSQTHKLQKVEKQGLNPVKCLVTSMDAIKKYMADNTSTDPKQASELNKICYSLKLRTDLAKPSIKKRVEDFVFGSPENDALKEQLTPLSKACKQKTSTMQEEVNAQIDSLDGKVKNQKEAIELSKLELSRSAINFCASYLENSKNNRSYALEYQDVYNSSINILEKNGFTIPSNKKDLVNNLYSELTIKLESLQELVDSDHTPPDMSGSHAPFNVGLH